MEEKVYLHTIYTRPYYKEKITREILEKILRCNELLSNGNLGIENHNFCGSDFISLSDFEKRNIVKPGDYNAYHCFGKYFTSIIFPKGKFEVYEPIVFDERITKDYDCLELMEKCGMSEIDRYTDLDDEVQVKDRLSLDYMSGLMVPCFEMVNFWLNKSKNLDKIKRQLDEYRKLLLKYGKEVPIYDSITTTCLDSDDSISECFDVLKLQR